LPFFLQQGLIRPEIIRTNDVNKQVRTRLVKTIGSLYVKIIDDSKPHFTMLSWTRVAAHLRDFDSYLLYA